MSSCNGCGKTGEVHYSELCQVTVALIFIAYRRVLLCTSFSNNAHVVGLVWNDTGGIKIRVYGKTACCDLSDAHGGWLKKLAPWVSLKVMSCWTSYRSSNFLLQ